MTIILKIVKLDLLLNHFLANNHSTSPSTYLSLNASAARWRHLLLWWRIDIKSLHPEQKDLSFQSNSQVKKPNILSLD